VVRPQAVILRGETERQREVERLERIEAGNVMPEMGVTDLDARDITAFLYTLK